MLDSSVLQLDLEPDMKITAEMGRVMGDDINSPSFQLFIELLVKGYLAIRPYREQIVNLVALMAQARLSGFHSSKTIKSLRARFQPDLSDREAAIYIQTVANKCYNNWRTNVYDNVGSLIFGVYC